MFNAHNIKEIRQLYNFTQEEFAQALDLTRELVNKMEKGKIGISKSTSLRIKEFMESKKGENYSQETTIIGQPASFKSSFTSSYFNQRQNKKNEKTVCLVPLVGVKAQAGYIKGYEQVDAYVDTLEKYSLPPGVNPGGAQWSYFEVDGDSMEPTFCSGDVILASMIHMEDWQEIKDLGVYVLLTDNSLLVKRVYKKSNTEWILLSDNEELYPQKLIPVNSIKEVWTFRRHINAKVPAPKDFQIKL